MSSTLIEAPAVRLPALLKHQEPIRESSASRKVLRCGRRFGKSRFAMVAALDGHGPQLPDGTRKFPGILQGGDVVWVAQDYPNLTTVMWREEFVPRFKHLPFVTMNANEHTIAFQGLGTLFLRPETAIGGIRGIGKNLRGVILDEAAWYDLDSALKDVILPALLDNDGWMILMSTTNNGEDGNAEKRIPSYFNLLCEEIQHGKRSVEWAEFVGTAYDNPRLNSKAIDDLVAEYKDAEVSLKQEVYAELVEPGAADQVIKREWCVAAAGRHKVPWFSDGEWALGVDPASSTSGDKGALAYWKGACLVEVNAFPCPDVNKLGEDVHADTIKYGIASEQVGIDSVGVGAGTVSTLWKYGMHHVRALNGGAKSLTAGPEKFKNLRAEMYWRMREDLRLNRVAIPDDQELISQLTIPRYEIRNGVICIESKEEIKKRMGGRSPDKADAVVYGNYVRKAHDPKPRESVDRVNRHPGFVEQGGRMTTANDNGRPEAPRSWDDGPKVPRYQTPTRFTKW